MTVQNPGTEADVWDDPELQAFWLDLAKTNPTAAGAMKLMIQEIIKLRDERATVRSGAFEEAIRIVEELAAQRAGETTISRSPDFNPASHALGIAAQKLRKAAGNVE